LPTATAPSVLRKQGTRKKRCSLAKAKLKIKTEKAKRMSKVELDAG